MRIWSERLPRGSVACACPKSGTNRDVGWASRKWVHLQLQFQRRPNSSAARAAHSTTETSISTKSKTSIGSTGECANRTGECANRTGEGANRTGGGLKACKDGPTVVCELPPTECSVNLCVWGACGEMYGPRNVGALRQREGSRIRRPPTTVQKQK